MDKRQHCLESEPTGLLRTDKGKNAWRELGKAEKGVYRMCASNFKGTNIMLAIIKQMILLFSWVELLLDRLRMTV